MGGLLILAAALVPTLLWADLTNVYIWIAVLATAAFGAIGFVDDYLKITRRSHHGLLPRYKMGCRSSSRSSSGSRCWCWRSTSVAVQHAADLSVLQAAHSRSRLVCTCRSPCSCWSARPNAVNLTDGLDGLAISTFAIAAAAYTALAYVDRPRGARRLSAARALPARPRS